MKLVVTGGAGFVGSYVVDRAIRRGHSVTVIDSLVTGQREWLHPQVTGFHPVDLNDLTAAHFDGADAVLHLAAYANLRNNWRSIDERDRIYRDNVDGTRRVLELMPRVPLVFASTASVYGAQRTPQPVVEGDATAETLQSPYAASKFACEAMVGAHAYGRGFPWYCLRFVNVVGRHTRHGVIGDFVRRHRETGHIHAMDNGKQRKSWVHAADAADAVLAVIDAAPSGIYNLTSRQRISWWDIIDQMGLNRADVTFEDRPGGAIGDPIDIHVSGNKLQPWHDCNRRVEDGIQEALDDLDWVAP